MSYLKSFGILNIVVLVVCVLIMSACFKYVHIPVLDIYYPNEVKLTLECANDKLSLSKNEYAELTVFMVNYRKDSVNMVHPGDGSKDGYRTPIIKWSVIKVGESQKHPTNISEVANDGQFRFCGNMNSLADYEFNTLHSRYRTRLNWLGLAPIPREIGTYSVKFYYLNDPTMKWKNHDDMNIQELETLNKIVNKSHHLALISNEILINVTK